MAIRLQICWYSKKYNQISYSSSDRYFIHLLLLSFALLCRTMVAIKIQILIVIAHRFLYNALDENFGITALQEYLVTHLAYTNA